MDLCAAAVGARMLPLQGYGFKSGCHFRTLSLKVARIAPAGLPLGVVPRGVSRARGGRARKKFSGRPRRLPRRFIGALASRRGADEKKVGGNIWRGPGNALSLPSLSTGTGGWRRGSERRIFEAMQREEGRAEGR